MGSATGDASKIYSPIGSKPNYTNMQAGVLRQHRRKALGGSIAYDFGRAFAKYGLSGLSLGLWGTQGWSARDPATGRHPDRNELNAWLQHRPASGPLQGFPFKTQYSGIWQLGNTRNPQSELRVVLDYSVLFGPPLQ